MNDVVKSVSISALCLRRDRLLEGVRELVQSIRYLNEISASQPGLPMFADWFEEPANRYANIMTRDGHPDGDPVERARVRIDREAWLYLMQESGITTYMDAKAREDWRESLKKEVPPLTVENITATFHRLYETRGEFLERGVINLFRSLSWDYKSNQPVKFGAKIIMDGMVECSLCGWHTTYSHRRDQLNDLERIFHVIEGRPEPDYPSSLQSVFSDAVRAGSRELRTEYADLRWFKKGSLHITFRRLDLVDRLNEIIAKHYPGALPPAR